MVNYIPKRGDIVWLNFNPQSGHEQGGKRPAFVISKYEYNKITGLMICCPITSKIKGYPFEVELTNLSIKGVVLSDQVKCLDYKARNVKFECEVTNKSLINKVVSNIELLIK